MVFLLSRLEIEQGFRRLGELALAHGQAVEFIVLGGTAMVLGFNTRPSTKDVDIAPTGLSNLPFLRQLAGQVAEENSWDESWLNDAAKGFLYGQGNLIPVYEAPGIRAYRPSTPQLLAMKLSAWRDDVDISDAEVLLRALSAANMEEVWSQLSPFVIPGLELKARYALHDLWPVT